MTCAQVWFHASCSSWLIGVSSATRATNRLTASDDGTRSLWPCPLALMRTTTASSDSSTQQSAALYLSAVITALLRSPRGAHTHGTHCTTGGVCVCALLDGEIGAHEHLAPEVEDGASAPLSRMNRSVNAPGAPRSCSVQEAWTWVTYRTWICCSVRSSLRRHLAFVVPYCLRRTSARGKSTALSAMSHAAQTMGLRAHCCKGSAGSRMRLFLRCPGVFSDGVGVWVVN